MKTMKTHAAHIFTILIIGTIGLAFSGIANATPPELTLMSKERLDNEKTFGFSIKVNPALGKRSVDLKVELVFDELAGCDGYAELDGMRVYSWKNRKSVAYAGVIDSGLWNYVTVASGTHKIRLVVSRPVTVHTFRLISSEKGGTQDVIDLREEVNVADQLKLLKARIDKLPKTQKQELLEWLRGKVSQ